MALGSKHLPPGEGIPQHTIWIQMNLSVVVNGSAMFKLSKLRSFSRNSFQVLEILEVTEAVTKNVRALNRQSSFFYAYFSGNEGQDNPNFCSVQSNP